MYRDGMEYSHGASQSVAVILAIKLWPSSLLIRSSSTRRYLART